MFRCVDLPSAVPGRLLLHSLPGRYEALERVWHQVRTDAVRAIVCLTERDEIHVKSYEYAQALDNGSVPCLVLPFEIPDRGAPEDRDGFWNLARDVATRLQVWRDRADSLRRRRWPHCDAFDLRAACPRPTGG